VNPVHDFLQVGNQRQMAELVCELVAMLEQAAQMIDCGRVQHGRRVLGRARNLIDTFFESYVNEQYRGIPPHDACDRAGT